MEKSYQHVLRAQICPFDDVCFPSIGHIVMLAMQWLTAPNFQQRCARLRKYEIHKNPPKIFGRLMLPFRVDRHIRISLSNYLFISHLLICLFIHVLLST